MTQTYTIEIANKVRNGRAVGTEYVVTQRPISLTGARAKFDTREQAAEWICKHMEAAN